MKLNKYQKQAIVTAIFNDMPKIDTEKRAAEIKAAIVKAMSPEVRKAYKTMPHALRREPVYYCDPNRGWSTHTVVGDVDEKTLDAITKPYRDEENARTELYQKLKGVVESCTTLKKLKELLPEFEAYFPTEAEPTKNLPAVANLVTDMMQMGWPKDKRKLVNKGEAK